MTDRCRWDRETEQYLRDGEPCWRDEYGDPTHHCTARRTCTNHIGHGELTCALCVGRSRNDLRVILARSAEMLGEALFAGVDSEAANLAGPAADVEAWMWRKVAAKQGRSWHASLLEDDDERHPYSVLTRWVMMLAEDYGLTAPTMPRNQIGLERAAAFLDRLLSRLAQDPEQDFKLFRDEIRKCRTHLEGVLRDSLGPERGVECPSCEGKAPRLTLERGHWCDDPECTRIHYPEDPDRYVCPRDRGHAWAEVEYRLWVADVYAEARRGAIA